MDNYILDKTTLAHYGTPRHSGRYPWGSGDNPCQRNRDLVAKANRLRAQGVPDREIARRCNITMAQLKTKRGLVKEQDRKAKIAMAVKLKEKGLSNTAIAERMSVRGETVRESNVRYWLQDSVKQRADKRQQIADTLAEAVGNKNYIDVSVGVEKYLDVSRTKLNDSVTYLQEKGYSVHNVDVPQLGTTHNTTVKVLCPPGTEWKDVKRNYTDIKTLDYHTESNNDEIWKMEKPQSISSSRVGVRYAEDGGAAKDGTVELRRGVADLDLGQSRYAQVRIAVDGTHYIKGMAVYSDNLPDGVDILVNSNKSKSKGKMGVLKEMEPNPTNPFGATIKERGQYHYQDADGNYHLGAINKVNEEGDWSKWSQSLASQVLSKQPVALAKRQLDLYYEDKKSEYEQICSLTNPTVKKDRLLEFADGCNGAAVSLKAAAMPRQATKVILPVTSLKEDEIYAPGYTHGEKVVLIRFPHGGKFEIPTCTVNNKNEEAISILGEAKDAVGIHTKTAERLSGADFDGDTVLVIPNNDGAIKTQKAIKELASYDPKERYPECPGMKVMSSKTTRGIEMGKITNLITDMTLQGAPEVELARAIRHSMVVIDAYKHKLNYKQSELDEGIAELKKKYQGGINAGAGSIISRAKSKAIVDERRDGYSIDPETGERVYKYTGRIKAVRAKDKDGNWYTKKYDKATTESTKMDEARDARDLIGNKNNKMEAIYADHANRMKALANTARKEYLVTNDIQYSKAAAQKYAHQVSSLKAKLNVALKNAPLERKAQIRANEIYNEENRKYGENWDSDDRKKKKGQALIQARAEVGAKKIRIKPTDEEWEAVQNGAINKTTLKSILDNSDDDRIRELTTPKQTRKTVTAAQASRIKSLRGKNYTIKEIADHLGLSASTVEEYLKG